MTEDIYKLRNDYRLKKLDKDDLHLDPIVQFKNWLSEAIESKLKEPTAMTLATVNSEYKPSARIVLLKFVNENGFAFFTNYESRKGSELKENSNGALVFYWAELERQVRIEGTAKKLSENLSDKYFDSRPEKSRISAIISPQSTKIPDRAYLEKLKKDFINAGNEIKRPENWGGYIISPVKIEFWQGRENRLHDRFIYEKNGEKWEINRLAP